MNRAGEVERKKTRACGDVWLDGGVLVHSVSCQLYLVG